jgi:hypothetical protein
VIHSNRFPGWNELDEKERATWISAAIGQAGGKAS